MITDAGDGLYDIKKEAVHLAHRLNDITHIVEQKCTVGRSDTQKEIEPRFKQWLAMAVDTKWVARGIHGQPFRMMHGSKIIPLNGYVNRRIDLRFTAGIDLVYEQVVLQMGVDTFGEAFAVVVEHAVVATGKYGH